MSDKLTESGPRPDPNDTNTLIVKYRCPHCSAAHATVTQSGQYNKMICLNCGKYIKMVGQEELESLPILDARKPISLIDPNSITFPDSEDTCAHDRVIPYEYDFATIKYNDHGRHYKDWTSNIINANRMRVVKLFCLDCKTILQLPSDAKD